MRTEKYFIDIVRNPRGVPVSTQVISKEEMTELIESGYAYVPVTRRKLTKRHKKLIEQIEKDYTDVQQPNSHK